MDEKLRLRIIKEFLKCKYSEAKKQKDQAELYFWDHWKWLIARYYQLLDFEENAERYKEDWLNGVEDRKQLKNVVAFYANPKNWEIGEDGLSECEHDGGRLAREVINSVKDMTMN